MTTRKLPLSLKAASSHLRRRPCRGACPGSRSSGVGRLAGGGGAGPIGPNLYRMPRSVLMRGDSG